jgi:quinol monooxygenase YgiN
MHSEITCIFQLQINPGKLDSFINLVSEIITEVKNESGTILYEYSIDRASLKGYIIERYKDSESLVSHVDDTFGQFAEKFLSFAKIEELLVHGLPNDAAKSRLNSFCALYFEPFAGCRKWE